MSRKTGIWLIAIIGVYAILLTGLNLLLDDTNVETANGLWKVPLIKAWMEAPLQQQIDPANILYFPFMAMLSWLIPGDLYIFQKLDLINGGFLAISNGFLFLVFRKLTGDQWLAIAGTLFHAGCGYVLCMGLSSEDIMPGYAMFVVSFVAFIYFLDQRKWHWLMIAALAYLMSWYLHWTLMFAWGFTMGATLLLMNAKLREKLISLGILAAITIIPAILLSLISSLDVSDVFLPDKSQGNPYIGIKADYYSRFLNALRWYFMLGDALPIRSKLHIILMLASVALLSAYLTRKDPLIKYISLMLGLVFLAGEFITLFDAPDDAQFQLQPMLWLSFGFLGLCVGLKKTGLPYVFAISLSFLIALSVGAANFLYFNKDIDWREKDTEVIRDMKAIADKIEIEKISLVVHPTQPILPFSEAIWNGKVPFFTLCYHEMDVQSREELTQCVQDSIHAIMDRGRIPVIDETWGRTEDAFANDYTLSLLRDPEQLRGIHKGLTTGFTARLLVSETVFGPLYVLEKKK